LSNHQRFKKIQAVIHRLGLHHAVRIPVKVHGEEEANLLLFWGKYLKFGAAEKRFLAIIAKVFSNQFTSFRHLSLARQRTEEAQVLQQINEITSDYFNVEKQFIHVAKAVARLIPFDRFSIGLLDNSTNRIKKYTIKQCLPDDSKSGTESQFGFVKEKDEGCKSTAASALSVLLLAKDKYLGMLHLTSTTVNSFSRDHQLFLERVGRQLSNAVHSHRFLGNLSRRISEVSAIARVSFSVAEGQKIHLVLENMVQRIRRLLKANDCAFILYDKIKGVPSEVRTKPEESQPFREMVPCFRDERNQKQKYYFSKNIAKTSLFNDRIGALLACPVLSKGLVSGFIAVQWQKTKHFAVKEMEFLRTMCNIIAISVDHEKMRHEEAKRRKRLEAVNSELEKFVYTVSHDLKSPVISIQGFSSILLEECKDDLKEDGLHYISRIYKNACSMEQLIDDLLAVSRVEKKTIKIEPESTKDIIEQALSNLAFQIEKNRINIKIDDRLPEIVCDRAQLVQVFTNLFSNAIKFRDKQKDENIIVVHAEQTKETLQFSIEDNGIGIPEKEHSRIFHLFERLHKKDVVDGTGIGLSITKQIIENHGGRIWLNSQVGHGTTFTFCLPVTKGAHCHEQS